MGQHKKCPDNSIEKFVHVFIIDFRLEKKTFQNNENDINTSVR